MGGNQTPKRSSSNNDRPAIWVGYGRLVKLFRERAGMTQMALADAIGYSVELVGAVEQGRRPAKTTFTKAVEPILNTGGVLQALQDQVDLAKLPRFFQDFAAIEAEAVSRFSYDPLLIPGLLQTEEYARALFAGHCPPLGAETIEQHVEARLHRQGMLHHDPPVALSFIIAEGALTNPVGGGDIMHRQMLALTEAASLHNVEIQVMPTTPGVHPGLNGPMVLLETTEHRHIGYVESQEIGTVVSDPAKVSAFGLRYGKLRSQALNVEESARLINRMAGDTWNSGMPVAATAP
ncbi:hypothetical protein SRB5_46600 [Streptomyces sp. RB5]|uniref:HTH cro/C1-type domain-containing protein n=1 Tax=Streptomyces smaragdinus TaxID=2585196 RepID=A0A7K0CN80_9ACTN|nr:helix-turn-helix transcriptional regulator [Streptomyces smaragdinus]MQY14492.1 hypothetical protein [Streptomyces smaragdinus]